MGYIKNITLTPAQEKYVRQNYNRMHPSEMAEALNVKIDKIYSNMAVMKLCRNNNANRVSAKQYTTKRGFFDETKYAKLHLI